MNAGIGNRESGIGDRESGVADRGSRIADRVASRRGQTATEYLMIAGIMTAIGLLVLLWFFQPWRRTVQDVTDCVRTDDCDAVGAK
jgi:hypothetical protein